MSQRRKAKVCGKQSFTVFIMGVLSPSLPVVQKFRYILFGQLMKLETAPIEPGQKEDCGNDSDDPLEPFSASENEGDVVIWDNFGREDDFVMGDNFGRENDLWPSTPENQVASPM
ncbi:hypothetical protein B0H19DRAFT_1067234 [Mycena capillaripes]|nr:hypothetical protein B0H19DRAFT_1067234 [Mycena capillaripes]